MRKPSRSSSDRRGFNAGIGNPPWVLYVGKGSQPIDAREKAFLEAQYGRGAKPLSTHGLFATLAGRLGQSGSRVALILPTSVADATRYSEVRASHNALCLPESDLPELGEDAFSEVFQPCMALLSTCRGAPDPDASGDPWNLAQHGVEGWVRDLLTHLDGLPKLPAVLFGERGFRSSATDRGKFAKMPVPKPPLDVPLYAGTSVREFELLSPTAFADGAKLPSVLPGPKWQEVDLFIRQTAKYPIVALSAHAAFRNSIIAGFGRPPFTKHALLAYLNSSPARWYHYHKQRDAQRGMPQVKVGHLRMLPAPQRAALDRLHAIGAKLGRRGKGITTEERTELDLVAANALGISAPAFERLRVWAEANPPPEGRLPARLGPGVRRQAFLPLQAASGRQTPADIPTSETYFVASGRTCSPAPGQRSAEAGTKMRLALWHMAAHTGTCEHAGEAPRA